MSQGMAVSNYKADKTEADRNRKRLMQLIKRPENLICADCPQKRKLLPFGGCPRRASPGAPPKKTCALLSQSLRTRGLPSTSVSLSASSAQASTATWGLT